MSGGVSKQQIKRPALSQKVHARVLRGRRLRHYLLSWLKSGPGSVTIAALIAFVHVLMLVRGHSLLGPVETVEVDHPWWTHLTSILWTADGLHAVINILLLLTLGIMLERTVGTKWFLVIGVVSHALASVLAVLSTGLIGYFVESLGEYFRSQQIAGVSGFLVAVAMAASVKVDIRWSRRIRLTMLTVLIVMIGFASTLSAISTVFAAPIGLVAGELVWRSKKEAPSAPESQWDRRDLVAMIIAAIVIGVLISLSAPQNHGVLSALRYQYASSDQTSATVSQLCNIHAGSHLCAQYQYLIESSSFFSRLLVLMPLFVQLVLVTGLRSGRRAALWGTVILQVAIMAISILHTFILQHAARGSEQVAELLKLGFNGAITLRFIVPIIAPLAVITLVIANRKLFQVKSAPGTYRGLVTAVSTSILISLGIMVVIAVFFRDSMKLYEAVGVAVINFFIKLLPTSLVPVVAPSAVASSTVLMHALSIVPLIPWFVLLTKLVASFRQLSLPGAISRDRYVNLVLANDAGTLGWISTWPGNVYWGSPSRTAGIAYRAHGGVALTVSDPAARIEDLPVVIEEFNAFCAEQGMTPAYYSVHSSVTAQTGMLGWPKLQVAEETVIQLEGLEFRGKVFQDVRTSLNRGEKEGISPVWTTWAEAPSSYRDQIRAISEQWVSEKPLPEMGFTLGGVAELDDPEVRILLAVDADNKIHGVTSWMPVYERGVVIGWTLDFMRRLDGGFKLVMEYLIAQSALWAKDQNYRLISLSGAPLAKSNQGQGEAADGDAGVSAAVLDGVLDFMGGALEPVYGFRSLLRFKSKFQPHYDPLFLSVPDVANLASVGMAVAHAYLPELSVRDAVRVAQSMTHKRV